MNRAMAALAAGLVLAATGASAQDACAPLDQGQYPIGQTLSQAQRTQIRADAPVGGLHCSRNGARCSVEAADGVVYSWDESGRIVRKRIDILDAATAAKVPGWDGAVDQGFADRLGQAACARFAVMDDELEGGLSLLSDPVTNPQGARFTVSVFGRATQDEPLSLELALSDQ